MLVRSLATLVASLAFALLAGGCTHGKGTYGDVQQLKLGITPQIELADKFGNPMTRATASENNNAFERRIYDLEAPNGSARRLTIELVNGVVNGYLYFSDTGPDRTAANIAAVTTLKPNVSTKADVARNLGEPGGRLHLPTSLLDPKVLPLNLPLYEGWLWLERSEDGIVGHEDARVRMALVLFDRNGTVIHTSTADVPIYYPRVYTQTYYAPAPTYYRPAPAHRHK